MTSKKTIRNLRYKNKKDGINIVWNFKHIDALHLFGGLGLVLATIGFFTTYDVPFFTMVILTSALACMLRDDFYEN